MSEQYPQAPNRRTSIGVMDRLRNRWATVIATGVAAAGVLAFDALSNKPAYAQSSQKATIGMPFEGKWAYSNPTSAECGPNSNQTSHPSCHETYFGDWSTDLYAADGTDVKLKASGESLSFAWDTSASGSCGETRRVKVYSSGTYIGRVHFTHLKNSASTETAPTNGITVGKIADLACNPGAGTENHIHVEFDNANTSTYSCYTNYSNSNYKAGLAVSESSSIGILGSSNTSPKEACSESSGGGDTPAGSISFESVANGQEFWTGDGWIYTKVGDRAWPIKNQGWAPEDDIKWGGHPVGLVPKDQVLANEVGYDQNGRAFAAHAPRDGIAVHVEGGNGQQYFFLDQKAWPINLGEVDDLGVRNNAYMVPAFGNRLNDFTDLKLIYLPDRSLYRLAGTPRVNLLSYHPGGSADAYHVNNDTVLDCLQIKEGQPLRILPYIMRYYLYDQANRNVPEIANPAACTFPLETVVRGPGGIEQWRITGDNAGQSYKRHYYSSMLLAWLHTNGQPDFRTLRSVQAINDVPLGPNMEPPEGAFFRSTGTGQVFRSGGGIFQPVPNQDTLICHGNPHIIDVPQTVMEGMPQGPPLTCAYSGRLIYGPDGHQFYISSENRRQDVGNPAISSCISVRRGAGNAVPVSASTINDYSPDNRAAWCNYEQELGLNFVRENNTPEVWLVIAGGIKRHVLSLCPNPSGAKKWNVYVVPPGETAGHIQEAAWSPTPEVCNALPG